MDIKTLYKIKLEKLLEKYLSQKETLATNGFLLFENIEKNALLFLGINPSKIDGIEKKYSVRHENGIFWSKESFKEEYPYYQHFNNLSCGMNWSHLDIFFSCMTNQKELEKNIKSEFLKEQFSISKSIIQKVMPKIIVVGNAYASNVMKEHFSCEFDKEIGTYRIKEYNNIPIFFSGIFTGGRALDVGSRERLAWHIGFVKEKTIK